MLDDGTTVDFTRAPSLLCMPDLVPEPFIPLPAPASALSSSQGVLRQHPPRTPTTSHHR